MINRLANIRSRNLCITRNRSKCVKASFAFQTICVIGLNKAIETVVGTSTQFNTKDVLCYLEAYKANMLKGDIPVSGFTRVVVLSVHVEILEMQSGESRMRGV